MVRREIRRPGALFPRVKHRHPEKQKGEENTMKVFIWQRVDKCTDNYHSEGGVVAVAASEEAARVAANTEPGCAIREDEHPDAVYDVGDGVPEAVYFMPDAGLLLNRREKDQWQV